MKIIVIGGGISGRLFQFYVPEAQILDWGKPPNKAKTLTRMYGANYLWEELPDIECKEFSVVTHVDGQVATQDSIRRYKDKIGKTFDQDNWTNQFNPLMTGYDIVSLPKSEIRYGCHVKEVFVKDKRIMLDSGDQIKYDVLISTVPLYALLDMCHIEQTRPFEYRPIFVRIEDRPLEAPYGKNVWYVNYLSDPGIAPYRFTDREGYRHYEGLSSMGKIPTRKIVPGKIYPNHSSKWVLESLEQDNIFCFGRFARWDPEELLHHTVQQIQSWKNKM